jgi:hypothetical protein
MWRRIARIREKYKCCSFRNLLGEGIIKDETIHPSLSFGNSICSRRHLVCVVFAIPLYLDESFCCQLLLGCRLVILCTRGAPELIDTGIEMSKGVRGIIQRLWGPSMTPRTRMLEYSKISTIKSAYASAPEWYFLHRLLVWLNIPGYGMTFFNLDPTNNIRL